MKDKILQSDLGLRFELGSVRKRGNCEVNHVRRWPAGKKNNAFSSYYLFLSINVIFHY